ncbi:MAG: hypothetical protein KAR47_08950 [Planctomycetes bacterium]|nr:hypothetical protein [Planctomycetota bacterium]
MEYTYSVLWRNGGPKESEKIAWHIRRIKTDGSFYGEIRFDSPNPDKRLWAIVEGVIPDKDLCRCLEILDGFSVLPIDDVSREPTNGTSGVHYGVLRRWGKYSESVLDCPVLYNLGDENNSDKARLFIELIEIMEKEISKSHHKIGQEN